MEQAIKPFCGTHYNPAKIADLSTVICPPYDVIDSKQLEVLRNKSAYNFSHVLLATGNNYKELGKKFRKWIDDEILIDDKTQSLYLYEQKFQYQGCRYQRFGFLALLRMDKEDSIYPHEHTLSKPKEDREKIINAMETNLSPIFVVIPETVEVFNRAYEEYSKKEPSFKFKDSDGSDNLVWRIDDKADINRLCRSAENYKLVIADGHHRFEVSYDYYQKNKNKFKDLNYILAFIASKQEGLLILPTHRIIKVKDRLGQIKDKLGEYFYISEVSKEQLENKLKTKGIFAFGVYRAGKFYFMELKNNGILDKIPGEPVYKKVDSYLLHNFILPLLAVEEGVEYTHSVVHAQELAGSDKCAFLIRAAALADVFEVANKGYRMPQKSTYFYPKVVSGAIIRRFRSK